MVKLWLARQWPPSSQVSSAGREADESHDRPTAPASWAVPQIHARLPLSRLERLQRVSIADKTALSGWKGGFVVPDLDASVASGTVLIKNSLRNSPTARQFDTVGSCPSADSLQIDIAAAVG